MSIFGPPLSGRPSALLETLDPIVVSTVDTDVQLTSKAGIRPWKIKLANESPYALRIDLGGYQDWIGPWTADVVPTGGATTMHVHPVALSSPLPASLTSVLLVTLAPQGEDFPGTYPMALSRQTSAFQLQAQIGTLSAGSGATVSKDFTIPAGSLAIGYAVRGDAGNMTPQSVTITGDQTQQSYFLAATATVVDGPQPASLDTNDTTITVGLTANATHPSAIDILAWPVLPITVVKQNPGALPIGVFLERSDGVAVDIDNPATGQFELGVSNFRATPAPWQRRAVDGSNAVANVQPGAASLAIPAAGAGISIILNYARFSLDNRSGAAVLQGVRVWDGASGSTLKWFVALQAANNAVDRDGPPPGTFIRGTPNTQMVLDFSGGAANLNESIAACWYLST